MPLGSAIDALAARLAADLPGIKWQRRPLRASDVREPPQGAVVAIGGRRESERDDPSVFEQTAGIVIYIQPTTATPDAELLALVDQVEDALAPHDGEEPIAFSTTLGGAVLAAWLTGYVLGDNPDVPGQVGAKLTVSLLNNPS